MTAASASVRAGSDHATGCAPSARLSSAQPSCASCAGISACACASAGEEVCQKRRAARGRHGHAAAQQRHAHGSRRHEPAGAPPREHAPPPLRARRGSPRSCREPSRLCPTGAVAPPIGKAPSMSTPPPWEFFAAGSARHGTVRPAGRPMQRALRSAGFMRPAHAGAPHVGRRASRRIDVRVASGVRCSRDSPSSSSRRSDSQ